MTRFTPVPLTRKQAQEFINRYHRHHQASVGDIFRVGLAMSGELIAVAMCGRPVSRNLCDGVTLEVNRLCVRDDIPGTKHAASALYARCGRIAQELGYTRVLTYTLADETGTSLVAAGWKVVYQTQGGSWSRSGRVRVDDHPLGAKTLWEAA